MRRIQKRILTYILPELAQSIVKRYGESAYLIGDLGAQAVLYMSLVDADFDENERRDGLSFVTRLYELHLLSEENYDKWMHLYKSQTKLQSTQALFDWAGTVPAILWDKYSTAQKKQNILLQNNAMLIQSQIVFMLAGISMISYAFLYALVSDKKVHKQEIEMLNKLVAIFEENTTMQHLAVESKLSHATKNTLPTELKRYMREFIHADILPKNLISHMIIAYNNDHHRSNQDSSTSLLTMLDDITDINVTCIREIYYFNPPMTTLNQSVFEQAKLPIEGTIDQKRFAFLEKDDLTVDTIDGITSFIDDDGERVEAAAQLYDMALDEHGAIRVTDHTNEPIVHTTPNAPKQWHELVQLLAGIPQLTYQLIEDKIFDAIEYVDVRLEAHQFVVQELLNRRVDIYEADEPTSQRESLTIQQIEQLLLDIHKRFDKSVFATYSVNQDRLYLYHDLLSRGEERDLCMARHELRQMKLAGIEVNDHHHIDGMIAAIRAVVINHNYRLVMRYASMSSIHTQHLDIMDLFQEGCIGLMIAVDKFDVTLNLRLSTYATWWIRQHIGRAIDTLDRAIRLPVHFLETMRRYKKFKLDYEIEHENSQISHTELAQLMNMKVSDITKIEFWDHRITSLQQPVGPDSDSELGDFIADETNSSSDTILAELQKEINMILANFAQRDQMIIEYRFGLNGNHSHTLDEVGKKLNITRERVRQIEKKLLEGIRKNHHNLQEYLH